MIANSGANAPVRYDGPPLKVDAIRHYISRGGKIIEGFLGQQNPRIHVVRSGAQYGFVVRGDLTEVRMYRAGNFGVDIYLPLSVLSGLLDGLRATDLQAQAVGGFAAYNPAGTERGEKRVPNVAISIGRVMYEVAWTRTAAGEVWAAEDGGLYTDLEYHDAESHKTWTHNPVMEPFELHLGVRGKAHKEDPFIQQDPPPRMLSRHILLLNQRQAARLLGQLEYFNATYSYDWQALPDGTTRFVLRERANNQEVWGISTAFTETA